VYKGDRNKNLDFQGKYIRLECIDGPGSCIIDCEEKGRGVRFFFEDNPNQTLDGFTIRNCRAASGAGIFMNSSNPTIKNVRIEDCYATSKGGGIYVHDSAPRIVDSTIIGCGAGKSGGGMMFYGRPAARVVDTQILRNKSVEGGGIMFSGGMGPTLNGVRIYYNEADYGGGVFIHSSSSPPRLEDCSIQDNEAVYDGGGFYISNRGKLWTRHSDVIDNNATYMGGGMALRAMPCHGGDVAESEFPQVMFIDGDFTSNDAQSGGGVAIREAKAVFVYTDFDDNEEYAIWVHEDAQIPLLMTEGCNFGLDLPNLPEDFNY
jgi:hypothetical protein